MLPDSIARQPETDVSESGYLRCEHKATDTRVRTKSNGVRVVVRQCLRCGGAVGTIQKRYITLAGIPEWDEELPKRWQSEVDEFYRRRAAQYEANRQKQNEEWWAAYDRYLLTPEWRAKRTAVLARVKGVCEGCGLRPPVQVHHTTYEHVGFEMLWELKAVCMTCHRQLHPDAEF
jgi:5-methylcytosine-specific restriction endonuclease McrA